MQRKYTYLLACLLLAGIWVYLNSNQNKTEDQSTDLNAGKKKDFQEYQALNTSESNTTGENPLESEVKETEVQTFQKAAQEYAEATKKCRGLVDEMIPGEDKSIELPDTLDKMQAIFSIYEGHTENMLNFNQSLLNENFEKKDIAEYLKNQDEDDLCYPYVEQELMMEVLDELTEEDIELSRKKQLRNLFVKHLNHGITKPQSVFHMASYLNMLQVLTESGLLPNHISPDLERMKTEVMQVVSETDERLLRSVQESDVDVYLETQRRRTEVLTKISQDFDDTLRKDIIDYDN